MAKPTRAEKKILALKRDLAQTKKALAESREDAALLRDEVKAYAASRGALAVVLRKYMRPDLLLDIERKVMVDAHLDPHARRALQEHPSAVMAPASTVVVRVRAFGAEDDDALLVSGAVSPFGPRSLLRVVTDTPDRRSYQPDAIQRQRFLTALWEGWLAGATLPPDVMRRFATRLAC